MGRLRKGAGTPENAPDEERDDNKEQKSRGTGGVV